MAACAQQRWIPPALPWCRVPQHQTHSTDAKQQLLLGNTARWRHCGLHSLQWIKNSGILLFLLATDCPAGNPISEPPHTCPSVGPDQKGPSDPEIGGAMDTKGRKDFVIHCKKMDWTLIAVVKLGANPTSFYYKSSRTSFCLLLHSAGKNKIITVSKCYLHCVI